MKNKREENDAWMVLANERKTLNQRVVEVEVSFLPRPRRSVACGYWFLRRTPVMVCVCARVCVCYVRFLSVSVPRVAFRALSRPLQP